MIKETTINKYIGKKYGKLTIVSFDKKPSRTEYFFNCKCECGAEKSVRLSNMQQKKTVSCGCYGKEINKTTHQGNTYRRKSFGENSLNTLIKRYKRDAKIRNIDYILTRTDFVSLTSADCFYCGAKPSTVMKVPNSYGDYTYNGIDRVDNNIGYTINNCVPSCKECNSKKNAITKEMIYKLYHKLFKP